MCIATTPKMAARGKAAARARRPPALLLLVIAGRSYRFWPHTPDAGLQSEERHVFRGPDGRTFSVYQEDLDYGEARASVIAGGPFPIRYRCEGCDSGDCPHIDALFGLGLL